MTKKDYIRAAGIIRSHGSPEKMIEAFVEFFAGDNPAFDVDRFIDACVGKTSSRARR
jgi:hypothetical protein